MAGNGIEYAALEATEAAMETLEARMGAKHSALKKIMLRLKAGKIKIKILLGFFQTATCLEAVYGVTLPPASSNTLQFLAIVNLNVFSAVGLPWACFGLGGYTQRLRTMMLTPIVLVTLVVLAGMVGGTSNGGYKQGRTIVRQSEVRTL